MIVINAAIKQEDIKKVVESISEPNFTFIKKAGLKLYFNCDGADSASAASIVKKSIKANPSLSMLFFSVSVE